MPHTGTGSEDAGRSDPRQETVVARVEDNSPAPTAPSEIAIATTASEMRALPVDKAEKQSVSSTAREPDVKQPRRRAVVRRVRKAPASEASAPARTLAHSTTTDHYDILAVLEMENRRLKQLLADKLRSENMLMRAMLQRIEARTE